jgi:hypothetical protein
MGRRSFHLVDLTSMLRPDGTSNMRLIQEHELPELECILQVVRRFVVTDPVTGFGIEAECFVQVAQQVRIKGGQVRRLS